MVWTGYFFNVKGVEQISGGLSCSMRGEMQEIGKNRGLWGLILLIIVSHQYFINFASFVTFRIDCAPGSNNCTLILAV